MDGKSDSHTAAVTPAVASPGGWRSAVCEVLAILLIFAAFGAWPVPDVNETAYLTKARHYADPAWGRGDFFLETPDAHGVFYLAIGPLAARLPLDQAAWIGRWLGWLAVAVGFQRAAMPLLPTRWSRILAAGLFALALLHTTAAGEWVIGGCEAKVFAWGFVLAAIGAIGRGRFAWAWLLLGAATAFHPIVGGWGLVALTISLLWRWLPPSREVTDAVSAPAGGWRVAMPLVLGGLGLAAAGVVPVLGLSEGADAVTRAAAAKIHVVERLPHHLLLRAFAPGMVARHLLAAMVWWLFRCVPTAASPPLQAARRRVDRFILASLVISLAGCGISLLEPFAATVAYSLLRFYWFRLADVLVPFGLATAAAAVLADDGAITRLVAWRPGRVRLLVAALVCLGLAGESRHWPLPGRTAVEARSDSKVDAAAWRETCDWVAAHTPIDAVFLTPRGAASFTWWTGRLEVANWKNSPQDARSLVAWRRRFADCFSRDGSFANMERSTAAFGPERMSRVAEQYGATHAIIPSDLPGLDALPFERLHANRGYAVYRLK